MHTSLINSVIDPASSDTSGMTLMHEYYECDHPGCLADATMVPYDNITDSCFHLFRFMLCPKIDLKQKLSYKSCFKLKRKVAR